MEQAVIDRFEGETAVLLVGAAQRPLDVAHLQLPPEAREGQWLKLELNGEQIVRIEIDEEVTAVDNGLKGVP